MDKCIACGMCAEKCPKKVTNEYDEGLSKRRAAHVKYAQAVPLKYAIDPENCIFINRGKCRVCEKICPTQAIDFDDHQRDFTRKVGGIILAGGCQVHDPAVHDVYGYGRSPNIVTSLEFERILSSSGPYGGHLVRPSDGEEPERIAWLQCIGSRDTHPGARNYCSSVCCTYAIKEAMLAREHSKKELDTAIFYMDIRTHGKDFEKYYNRGRDEFGIRFVKSKISNIVPADGTARQLIRYIDETGRRIEEEFDIIVLSVGLEVSKQAIDLANRLGLELDEYGFAATTSFQPVETSAPGIFVCGAFGGPKDIPSSIMEASAAAGVTGGHIAKHRWTRTQTKETPEEIDIRDEPIRIGVFVCRCGTNIGGVVDVPTVVEFAKTLPGVVFTDENMFSCSQDTQESMAGVIKEKRLNRIVVAACTPKTHEPLFQETLINAGLNKYLFEMVNIRNQCSWVHGSDPEAATEKAKALVKMGVAKANLVHPLSEQTAEVNRSALVIGGGISGMTAARTLSKQGYRTHIVEQDERLGGQAWNLNQTWRGEDVQEHLKRVIESVQADQNIDVRLKAKIESVEGFVGNFKTTVTADGKEDVLEHGVTIIASGASELKPDQYLYGKNPRVLTGLELDQRFAANDQTMDQVRSAVFIQCVGSRIQERPYCSKVCCTHSVRNALKLRQYNPKMDIFILHRDIRTYGLQEDLYREARARGIQFIRYNDDKPLTVDEDGEGLRVRFTDTTLRRKMEIRPDLLVLASAIVPQKDNALAQMYKATLNEDGFFVEAHMKLRPVDCATDGVFICGLAHAPKPIDESIAQAQAAASRALTILTMENIVVSGLVSYIDPDRCSGCFACVNVCPYGAISFNEEARVAEVNQLLCKGCGVCAVTCPSEVPILRGFNNNQLYAQINSALAA